MPADEAIIRVENLSKCYHIWSSPLARLIVPLLEWFACWPLPRRAQRGLQNRAAGLYRNFFALHDVSFEVRRGESVGIIGRNGSGKSTLLQILTGTLQPTGGEAQIRGRVAALLELGSGFNPEFTGRENVRLNAALHGLSPEQIDERIEKMLTFADIGQFVEEPVKTYSSGMMLRLAFAVIAHIDADILIIDEALAVGDAAFSRKCIASIERFQEGGGTLLLVSHDPGAVLTLCDKALLLERSEMLLYGPPKLVTSQYLKLIFASAEHYEEARAAARAAQLTAGDEAAETSVAEGSVQPKPKLKPATAAHYAPGLVSQSVVRYASRGARIENPRVEDDEGRPVNVLVRGERYTYAYEVNFTETCYQVRFGMLIKTTNGTELGGAVSSTAQDTSIQFAPAGSAFEVRFGFTCHLLPNFYFLNAGVEGLVDDGLQYLHRVLDAYMFRIMDETQLLPTGIVDFAAEPQIREIDTLPSLTAAL